MTAGLLAIASTGPRPGIWLAREGDGSWQTSLLWGCEAPASLAWCGSDRLLAVAGDDEAMLHEFAWGTEERPVHRVHALDGRLPVHVGLRPAEQDDLRVAVPMHLSASVCLVGRGPSGTITVTSQLPAGALPHQCVWSGDAWLVPDLKGTVHRLDARGQRLAPWQLDAGLGPRHIVRLGERWALSCEYGNAVAFGAGQRWRVHPSTAGSGESWAGDLQAVDQRRVAVANRGIDSIGIVDAELGLVAEHAVPAWPQHLAPRASGGFWVACRDANRVMALCPGRGALAESFELDSPVWVAPRPA